MLRVLKTELEYFLPWVFGGLGIALFVVVLLSVLIRIFEEGEGPPAFVVAMMPIIAGMVVSFIAQSQRVEERRARLLLSGALTPRQLAGVTVLLPLCFVGLGTIAAVPMIALATLIAGKFEASGLSMVAGFSGQFWAYAQLGPLAGESSVARRQQRSGASTAGWAVFAVVILVLTVSQFFMLSVVGIAGVFGAAFAAMGFALALYLRRTDFTR